MNNTDNHSSPDGFDPEKTMPGIMERKDKGRFQIGDTVMGRYTVLAELGQGGMGVVYKCLDTTGKINVALKALPPELSHNSLEMEDIRDNFALVEKLHHPNIANIKQLERDPGTGDYYLIMECVEGENLKGWLRRRRKEGNPTVEQILPIIKQVANALDYAHSQKVIHRDIKPGNIIIGADGTVKVLDFGLAAEIHTSMTRVSMAYHGTSGTGPYMAPEQWRGKRQGAPADQYALAVMTYEMLAGHQPFESTDAAVLKQAVLDETPDPIPEIGAAAWSAISRAMSKDPAERFESCSAFAEMLNKISQSNSAPSNHLAFRIIWGLLIGYPLLAGTLDIIQILLYRTFGDNTWFSFIDWISRILYCPIGITGVPTIIFIVSGFVILDISKFFNYFGINILRKFRKILFVAYIIIIVFSLCVFVYHYFYIYFLIPCLFLEFICIPFRWKAVDSIFDREFSPILKMSFMAEVFCILISALCFMQWLTDSYYDDVLLLIVWSSITCFGIVFLGIITIQKRMRNFLFQRKPLAIFFISYWILNLILGYIILRKS